MTAGNDSMGEARSVDTGWSSQLRDGAATGRIPSIALDYVACGTVVVRILHRGYGLTFTLRLITMRRVITASSRGHEQ
jgi:hypothetical protein